MANLQHPLLPTPQRVRPGRGSVRPNASWVVGLPHDPDTATQRAAAMLAKQLGTTVHAVAEFPERQLAWGPRRTLAKLALDRPTAKPEGYTLRIATGGVVMRGADDAGLFYATRTLAQLTEPTRTLPVIRIDDWPVTRLRAIHFDLKGLMPTPANLRRMIDRLADLKVNAVLAEWEDKILLDRHPDIASPLAMTKAQVRSLVRYAADRHIRLTPLQQTLGHLEYVLKHPRYARYREAGLINEIDPLNTGAVRTITQLVDDMADAHADPDFHIGADEAWGLGTGKATARYVRRHGKDALLLKHIQTIADHVHARGLEPLIWDDMFRRMTKAQLRQVRSLGGLVCWLYHTLDPRRVDELAPMLARYRDAGLRVIGASAVKGADGSPITNVVKIDDRCANVDFWATAVRKYDLEGVIATAWSRFNSLLPQCDPWEGSWYPTCYAAERGWAGTTTSRAAFDHAFCHRQLGLDGDASETVDLMRRTFGNHDHTLSDQFTERANHTRSGWGRQILTYYAAAAQLEDWLWHTSRSASHIASRWPYFTSGQTYHEPHHAVRHLTDLLRAGEAIQRRVRRCLAKTYGPTQADEFIATRFAGSMKLIGWAVDRTLGRPIKRIGRRG